MSSLEYIGAPRPTGTPLALISIIAPHEEPAFLIASKYFSHNFNTDLSGQKSGFFKISLSLQLLRLHPKIPNLVTAPTTLNFFPSFACKTFFAIAPAATLAAVSLADCLPHLCNL